MSEGRRVGIGSRLEGVRVNGGEPMPINYDVARGRLAELTYSQLHLQRIGAFNPFLESPLSSFSSSFLAEQLDKEGADEVFDLDKENDYRDNMQGKIFELLAYGILSAWQPDNRAVLSPLATKEYFKALYPRHRVINTPGGHGTIGGVYVPDGLIVKIDESGNPTILTVLEGTKNIVSKIKEGQLESDIVRRAMEHPMMDKAQLALVFPTQEIPNEILRQLGERVCYMFPFNSADFGMIAEEITNRVLENREGATLDDVKQRTNYQNTQLDRGLSGPDPLPWILYADTVNATVTTNPEIEKY